MATYVPILDNYSIPITSSQLDYIKAFDLSWSSATDTPTSSGGTTAPTTVQVSGTKPVDWVSIDQLVDLNIEQKAVLLYHIVGDPDYDSVAFYVKAETSGTVTVDWGDGVIDTVANGEVNHNYNYDDITSPLTVDGYKQCVVTITSTSNITEVNFNNRFNGYGEYSLGFVDGVFSLPFLTTTRYCFNNMKKCQYLTFGDAPLVTNSSYMFYGMSSCKDISVGDFPETTTTIYMFYGATAVTKMRVGNFPKCTSSGSMFYGMSSCKDISVGDFPNSTYTGNMFYGLSTCETFRMGDYSASTSAGGMFARLGPCSSFTLTNYTNDINLYYSRLSKFEIVKIFNSLGEVTDKTITITGASGASGLTEDELAIPVNLGWTILN